MTEVKTEKTGSDHVSQTGVLKKTLPNGLEIYLQPMQGVRSVSMGVAIRTGAASESEEIGGIAHYIEHMVFKGTKTRNAFQIKEPIEKVGGTLNAFTGKESTVYFARIPDSHFEIAADILMDICSSAVFPEEQVLLEKQVIMEEISAAEDDPLDKAYENLFSNVWSGCEYANPVLGTDETVGNIDRKALEEFFTKNYVSSNTCLSIAGNFDEGIIDKFQGISHGYFDEKRPRIIYSPERKLTMESRADIQQIQFVMSVESPGRKNEYFDSLQVLNTILSGGMSSRLFNRIRDELGLVYSIDTGMIGYPEGGLFYIYAATSEEKIFLLIDELKSQIISLLENGVTDEELEYGKERLKGKLLLSTESTYSSMMRNLDIGLAFGRPLKVDEIEEKIEKVSRKSLLDSLGKYFSKDWIYSLIVPNAMKGSNKLGKALERGI